MEGTLGHVKVHVLVTCAAMSLQFNGAIATQLCKVHAGEYLLPRLTVARVELSRRIGACLDRDSGACERQQYHKRT